MMSLRKYYYLLLLCTLTISVFGQNISFKAQATSSKVGVNDAFEVTFTITNAKSLSDFTPPKFSGFTVLNGPMQSTNEYMEISNGQRTVTRSIIISYVIKANKIGKHSIAKASATSAGNVIQSNTVAVEVVKASQNQTPQQQYIDPFEDFFQQRRPEPRQELSSAQLKEFGEANLKNNVFIKVTVNNTQPYIGEQIIASYKLYSRIPMSVNITELPALNGFWSEEYTLPPIPRPKEEIINGKSYQVFELKRTALFPQQVGTLTLDAAKASGTAKIPVQANRQQQNYSNDPMLNMLMNDPFFDHFSNIEQKEIPIVLKSEPVQIQVKPLPESPDPNHFNGAVGRFTINTTIDKTQLTTDEVAKYEIIIKGNGNFQLMSLPKISFPKELGFSEPEVIDSITSRNPEIEGYKKITYFINPTKSGTFEIPSVLFYYFDPTLNKYVESKTKDIKLNVLSGTIIDEIEPKAKTSDKFIYIISIILILCIIIAITYVFLKLRKKKSNINEIVTKNELEKALLQLNNARKESNQNNNQFYEFVSRCIWNYLSEVLNIEIATITKDQILSELQKNNIDEQIIIEVEQIIHSCEQALYAPFTDATARKEIIDQTQNVIIKIDNYIKYKK